MSFLQKGNALKTSLLASQSRMIRLAFQRLFSTATATTSPTRLTSLATCPSARIVTFPSQSTLTTRISTPSTSKIMVPLRKFSEQKDAPKNAMTHREAINYAIAQEMTRDKDVFVMGEEVAQYDGAYKVTKGLLAKFGPDRIIDTPITEMGFTGLAVGAAQAGLKPICEFMTFNFALQAIDHIINSAAKVHYMSGGRVTCPIVFRGPNGAPGAVGAQHSQDFASWFGSVPGLKVFAPCDNEEAMGMLRTAVRDPNPVVYLESESLYGVTFSVEDHVLKEDFTIPFGKAKIHRSGNDVTIVTYSKNVHVAMQAAEKLAEENISAEVINLRSIRPLDRETIIESVKKTGRLVTVEECWPQHGVGAEIHALVNETCWDYLDAPPARVTAADVPMPYAFNLEDAAKAQPVNVVNVVKRVVARNK